MTHKEYLTTNELSSESGYSLRAIQLWCQEGKLPSEKMGRDYLIRYSDWLDFLKAHNPQKRNAD
jgi:excisionase family DNA binding protein